MFTIMSVKKMALHLSFLLTFILFLSSCVEPLDVQINFSQDTLSGGSIYLVPDRPTALTFIQMNDQIILENAYVKSVTIHAVPEGEHYIQYSSGDPKLTNKLYEKILITLPKGGEKHWVVKVPPYSESYWTKLGLSEISGAIYYAAGILYLGILLL
jgi:hypothetical protein